MAYNGAIVCCHMPMEVEEEERRRRGRIKEKSRRWLKKNKVVGGGGWGLDVQKQEEETGELSGGIMMDEGQEKRCRSQEEEMKR